MKTPLKGYSGILSLVLVFYLFGIDRIEPLIVMLFIGYGFLGLIVPITTVLALEGQGAVAGSASALMGAARFLTGAVIMGGIGLVSDGSPFTMVGGIAACSITALFLATGPWEVTQESIRKV